MLVESRRQRPLFIISGMSTLIASIAAARTLAETHFYDGVLSPELVLGSLGFDAMTLLVSTALIACLFAIDRGRQQYWMPWLGLQAYLAYAYAMYAFGLVYTPLYFLYIAVLGLSVYAIAMFRESMSRAALAHWRAARMPRRSMAAFLFVLAGTLAVTWTLTLASAVTHRDELPGATVVVLDLALALPLLAVAGVLLLRRKPLGDLIAPAVFVWAAAITFGVAAGELFRPVVGDDWSLGMAIPFLVPGVVCFGFAIVAFRRVSPAITRLQR